MDIDYGTINIMKLLVSLADENIDKLDEDDKKVFNHARKIIADYENEEE